METIIYVDNLKCGGCANTITKNVKEFKNVDAVVVDPEESKVTIQSHETIDLTEIKNKLHQLGYPEKDTTEGLDKFASNVKSYVSCAIGKFTSARHKRRA